MAKGDRPSVHFFTLFYTLETSSKKSYQAVYNTIYNNMNDELKASRTISMSMDCWRMAAALQAKWNLRPSQVFAEAIKQAHNDVMNADKDYQAYLQKHGNKLPHQTLEKVASFPLKEISKD